MTALPADTYPWTDDEADVDLENWTPLDLTVPENLLRQLGYLMKRMDHIQDQARAMREPIDRWEQDKLDPLMERAAYLNQALQEIARRYRAADERHNKTLTLPSGRVESRTTRPRLDITDEDALVPFLRHVAAELGQPVEDYLAVKVTAKKAGLLTLIPEVALENGVAVLIDGEPIPGVSVVPGGVSFTVKPS